MTWQYFFSKNMHLADDLLRDQVTNKNNPENRATNFPGMSNIFQLNLLEMSRRFFVLFGSCLLVFLCLNISAQNLLNMTGWKIGSGSASGFNQNGTTSENERIWGTGPLGNRVVLWEARPDANSGPDGGWVASHVTIDHTKMYRLVVWIKKTGNTNGATYFGVYGGNATVTYLNGSVNNNPYFWAGDLPELDKWYLLVGYVHGSGDNATTSYGGIYDGVTGEKVVSIADFKSQTTTTSLSHRTYLFYNTDTGNRQYWNAPRLDEVNGNEPSIAELLGLRPGNLEQLSVGTANLPSGYKLSVGGHAIMEKVKVQVEGSWPDYVFDEGYPLLPLNSLEQYIKTQGHLPNMPKAAEVEAKSQDLGLIQQKLLEKVEEMTLYIINQHHENQTLIQENVKLRSTIDQVSRRLETLEKRLNEKY